MGGIRFYKVIWQSGGSYHETVEIATCRRNLNNAIKRGDIKYLVEGAAEASKIVKIQEMETPMIDMQFLIELFTTGSTKKNREAHKDQTAYVLRLVENCAARVMIEDGKTVIER